MDLGIPAEAVCLKCGYALRGLHAPICPECGRAFEPADANTYRIGGRWSRKWREWAEPPAGWHIYGMIALTVLALYETSVPPGPDFGLSFPIGCFVGFIGPFFVVGVVIDYLVRLVAIKVDRARSTQDRGLRSRRRNRRFVITPSCIVLIISMFATAWPMRIRFGFSRTAFERVARQCLATGKSITGDQWIGLYYIENVQFRDGEVHFQTGPGLIDPVGFVFNVDPTAVNNYIQRIAPHWYTYED